MTMPDKRSRTCRRRMPRTMTDVLGEVRILRRELSDIRTENGQLWGAFLELGDTLRAHGLPVRPGQLDEGEEVPERYKPERTVLRVWVPRKTRTKPERRVYGALRYSQIVEVEEGHAAAQKLEECTDHDVFDAPAFWGSVVDSIDRMPPDGGYWIWTGLASWSTQHEIWTLTEGEWSKEEEGN